MIHSRPARRRRARADVVACAIVSLVCAAHAGAAAPSRLAPQRRPVAAAASRAAAACPHPPESGGPADAFRILDSGNDRVQTFVARLGVFAGAFGSAGDGDGEFAGARGIASAPWDVVYVADTGNDRVQRFDRGGGFLDTFGSAGTGAGQFDGPTGIGVDASGNIFVLDSGNDRVQKFDMNGAFVAQWGAAGTGAGQFRDAVGLAVSWSDGTVYVADSGNDRIQRFDNTGALLGQWGVAGDGNGEFDAPVSVAVHPTSGAVYVADSGNDRIQQFTSGGGFVRAFGATGSGLGQLENPTGVAVGARDGVVVVDSGNDRIQWFGDDGTFVSRYGSAGTDVGQFNGATTVAANFRGVDLDQCHVHDLTLPDGRPRRIVVYYTTTNGLAGNRLDDVDDAATGANVYAQKLAMEYERAWQAFDRYGLGEANQVREIDIGGADGLEHEVWVFDIASVGYDGWCCGPVHSEAYARMVVDALNNDPDAPYLGEVAVHELFHSIQPYTYRAGAGEPGWSTEGQAANMQDKVATLQDLWTGSAYVGRVNDYLVNRSATDLRTIAYPGALFWNYIEEQVGGATPPDPGYGVSAMAAYFAAVEPLHGLDAVDAVVRAAGPRRIEEFWTDFTIANYTKRLAGAGPRYAYVDEPPTPYSAVPAASYAVTAGTSITVTRAISAYAATYDRFEPDTTACRYVALEFQSDRRVGFSVADHSGGILERPPERFWGRRRIVAFRLDAPYIVGDGQAAIVTGLAEPAEVALRADCVNPTLAIVRPTTAAPGLAGPFNGPGTIVAYVSVRSGAYGPVRGMVDSAFTARIGGRDAVVLAAVGLEDLYALVLQAPAQPADGDYDLEVTLDGTVTATEADAVRYTTQVQDTVLVLDRSGSMLYDGKMTIAKEASQLEITEMDRAAFAGLVSFASTAATDRPLRDITVEPARTELRTAVDALAASGTTAIVHGLGRALDGLAAPDLAGHGCGITLLTDGMENASTPAERAAVLGRLAAPARPCPVFGIALGPEADAAFLQQFADATGGQIFAATLAPPSPVEVTAGAGSTADGAAPAAARAAATAGAIGASWQGRLVSHFDAIAARQAGRQRVLAAGRSSIAGGAVETVPVDASVSDAVFAVFSTPGLAKNAVVVDPAGTIVDGTYPGATFAERGGHKVVTIKGPRPGDWQVRLQGQSGYGYVVMTSAETRVGLDVLVRPPKREVRAGHRVPIVAVLHDDKAALPGATVEAAVQAPDGTVHHLPLRDDGRHGDGGADDGIYGNTFTRSAAAPCRRDTELGVATVCDSAYQIDVVARKGDVRREAQAGFAVQPAVDRDNDALPDEWERAHGIDPKDPGAAKDDPDLDGLATYDEYVRGTDPFEADTDEGGENDGSEARHGRNPLAPEDDRMRRWHEIAVHAADGVVEVGLSADKGVAAYRIDRQLGDGVWRRRADRVPATGVFVDKEIKLGETYVYRVVPIGPDGAEGVPLTSVAIRPKADNEAPRGWLTINDLAPRTASRRVSLAFGWETDAVAMRLGNQPALAKAKWQPLVRTLAWELPPQLAPGQTGHVYVEFRDRAGNVSDISIRAAIVYDPTAPKPTPTPAATAPAPATPSATAAATTPPSATPRPTPPPEPPASPTLPSATRSPTTAPPATPSAPTPQPSPTGAPTTSGGGFWRQAFAPFAGKP